jgi:hypothetical protein
VSLGQSNWRKPARWLVILGFLTFVALVVGRSFQVAGYQCTVCMTFGGHDVCRTVEGATAQDARTSAINNACAHLASGVTDSMACERSQPTKADCWALN